MINYTNYNHTNVYNLNDMTARSNQTPIFVLYNIIPDSLYRNTLIFKYQLSILLLHTTKLYRMTIIRRKKKMFKKRKEKNSH